MSKLSDNLKILRMIYGLSVRQVAQKIDRSASSLSNWENERQLPDTDSLTKLCHLYKVTPNEILDWEPCALIKDYQRLQAENIQKRNKLIEQRKALDEQIKQVEKVMIAPEIKYRVWAHDPITGKGHYMTSEEVEKKRNAHLENGLRIQKQTINAYKKQHEKEKEDKS